MNKQEAFDAVWKWFVVDGGQKSEDSMGMCLYRGPNGARCAAGVLIPDELYSKDMEGASIGILMHDSNCLELSNIFEPIEDLVREMQTLHDGARVDVNQTWRHYVGNDLSFPINDAPSFADYMRQGLTIIADRHNIAIQNAESAAEPA